MKKKVFICVFSIILFTVGLSQEKIFRSFRSGWIDPNPFEWPVSTPEEQGIDSSNIEMAFKEAEKLTYVHSLLVVRNGYLIAERYYTPYGKNDAHFVRSVSKSFLSALVGIALRENYLTSLDQKMLEFFPEYIYLGMNPRKHDITIKHLLTMKTGFDDSIEDYGDNFYQWMISPNWIKYAIELPLRDNPGERYAYITAVTHILSGVITKATSMSTLEFAKKYLFDPLNISIIKWEQDPQGYYIGGFRMMFSPRDMARFGYLYLKNGLVDGLQILPAEWIEESLQDYKPRLIGGYGYGYLWRIDKINNFDLYFASGYGGQKIIIIPGLNMVIVTTAYEDASVSQSSKQWNAITNLVLNHIVAPLCNAHESPPHIPAGISGRKVENRSLTQVEYINVLNWQPNPRNNGINILKYRIYQLLFGNKMLLDQVNANELEYWHRKVSKRSEYTYGISSVTDDDRESIAAVITIR